MLLTGFMLILDILNWFFSFFVILDCINLNISLDDKGIITNEEIPSFIINVFVYYYLFIGRKDLAINILKIIKIKEINFIGK